VFLILRSRQNTTPFLSLFEPSGEEENAALPLQTGAYEPVK
jgi:hypothetical protein